MAPSSATANLCGRSLILLVNFAALASAIVCEKEYHTMKTIGHQAESDFYCSGVSTGQVKIYWEADDASVIHGDGHDDYTVRVFDDSDLLEGHNKSTYPLFMSKTHKGLSSGSSELFGPDAAESNQTRENWRVQFKCSNFIFPCNDMRFSFVLLSCGCPRGQIVSKSCNASFMAWQKYEGSGYYWTSASDAVCVDGPPTSAPTFMPIAMTLTLRPSALSREVQSGVKKGWKPSFPLFLYTLLVAITAINN